MPANTFVDGTVVTAAAHNQNWALAVLTDTARTITVTHTWTASQTFTGGASFGAAITGSVSFTGTVTVTAAAPKLIFTDTNGTANKATIHLAYNTSSLDFEARADDGSFTRNVLTLSHDGVAGVPTLAISAAATTQSAGVLSIGNTTQSTVGAAGGASALPATPTGYIKTYIGSTQYVIPYYAQA